MSKQKAKAASQEEPAAAVDRLRDIIFGAQSREYEDQFQSLQRALKRLQQETDRLRQQQAHRESDETEKIQQLQQEVQRLHAELRAELRQINQQNKTEYLERPALAKLLIKLGTDLKEHGS
jgi:acetyl-CoA carboxylase alpha subunit